MKEEMKRKNLKKKEEQKKEKWDEELLSKIFGGQSGLREASQLELKRIRINHYDDYKGGNTELKAFFVKQTSGVIWNLFWREAIKSSIKLGKWIRVFAIANRVLGSIEQTLDLIRHLKDIELICEEVKLKWLHNQYSVGYQWLLKD